MKHKFLPLIALLIFLSSCKKEQQNQVLPYINITVNGTSFKMDSVFAIYDDSAGVMNLIGTSSKSGIIIAIGFKFSTLEQIPRTYDATKTPIELLGIYKDSTGVYSTATVDSLGNPASPIGTGILNLTSHSLQTQTIAGNFELRPKEVDPLSWEPKTKTIQISGSFQTFYFILTRGGTPAPLKIVPKN